MAEPEAEMDFLDLSGRRWRIAEVSISDARRALPGESFSTPDAVTLLFESDGDRLYMANAPSAWRRLPFGALSDLLRKARPAEPPPGE